MSNLRDELQDATNHVSIMTNEFTSLKVKLNDNSGKTSYNDNNIIINMSL